MEWVVCPLFSGSRGNSCFFATQDTRILVDAGMPLRDMEQALACIGGDFSEIHAILVTHEHIDHIRSLGAIARKYRIPIYAPPGTWTAIRLLGKCGQFPLPSVVEFDAGRSFCVRGIRVQPFATSHDAAEPTGYALDNGRTRVGYMTDTGHVTAAARSALLGCRAVVLESNHDPELLSTNPHYPAHIKARIAGRKGHLNNGESAQFLMELVRSGLQQAALAHLSAENNTPELAYDTAQMALLEEGLFPGRDLLVTLARQEGPTGLIGL